jgi:hypothetical protein
MYKKEEIMKAVVADAGLVGYCGLYCGACGSYLKDRCPGCHENQHATWCKVRECCRQEGYSTCAECGTYADPEYCTKFNNLISKIIGFVLRSDRSACIKQVRNRGLLGHAEDMALHKRQTIRPGR